MLGPDEWTQGAQRQAHSHSTSFPSAEVDALAPNESPVSVAHQGLCRLQWQEMLSALIMICIQTAKVCIFE